MKILWLVLLCFWIDTARADLIPSGRYQRRFRPAQDEEREAEGAAAIAAIAAAAGLALAAKKKKKGEKTPEELVIDQDQPEESEDA